MFAVSDEEMWIVEVQLFLFIGYQSMSELSYTNQTVEIHRPNPCSIEDNNF